MFCSSCGAALPAGLSYCNHCGARLSAAKTETKSSEVVPELLVAGMVALFVFGLVAITFMVFMMKEAAGFDLPFLLIFTTLSFVLLFSLEAVLIRLLLRKKRGTGDLTDADSAKRVVTNELQASAPKALRESLPSVTENTTRTFEPIYNKPKSS